MSIDEQHQWTAEEQQLIEASRGYFAAIAACEQAGGRTQAAILAAMPSEVAEQMGGDMASALSSIG